MCSRCRKAVSGEAGQRVRQVVGQLAGLLLVVGAISGGLSPDLPASPISGVPAAPPLRVCADPNNLPFSNQRLEGLENRLAEMVADEMNTSVGYVWWAQRRGFVRNTLDAGLCDVVMGVPTDLPSVLTTRPYYRSSYVFLTRRDHGPAIEAFDDPRLRRLRIGVQVVGDGANTPPMDALARRGLARNLIGYTVFGDYAQPNPPARIVEAVARGDVDLAVVWGPLAGFFAGRSRVPLVLTPVPAPTGPDETPSVFSISMGVRKGDTALRATLDRIIERRRQDVHRLLDEYGVPGVD